MTEQPHDDKLLIGHEYDGIQELDNDLPRWWLYGFYFTILFSIVYMLYYEVTDAGPTMEQEYEQELRDAGIEYTPSAD